MVTRRLNLSLPSHVDDTLGQLSALTGRSKSSFVLEALQLAARHFSSTLSHLRAAEVASSSVVDAPPAQSVVGGSQQTPEVSSPLTRQQRRANERLAKKGRA